MPALLANTITPRRAIKNYQLNSLINLRYVALRVGVGPFFGPDLSRFRAGVGVLGATRSARSAARTNGVDAGVAAAIAAGVAVGRGGAHAPGRVR